MSEITIIPDHIVRRIAAGEVITRPLNIIKELIENAIDAQSTQITVTFENGGIDRITVKDNGIGIPADKLQLAFQLHTSSKVISDNIHNISTLGFRGEALASIVAVAKVRCRSKYKDSTTGREIIFEGGKMQSEKDVRMTQQGTEMEIIGIFYNIPARRKFLRKPATERLVLLQFLTHIMLMYHGLHIKVIEKQRTKEFVVLESPQRKKMLAAIYDVLGAKIAGELAPVQGMASRWQVEGFISKPILTRKDRSQQYIRVNGRAIKHTALQKAIEEAYGSQLLKSNYPVVILDLKGQSDWVDFNIHPQKSEIQFAKDDPILEEITKLVQLSLTSKADFPKFHKAKIQEPQTAIEIPQNVSSAQQTAKTKSMMQYTIDAFVDNNTTTTPTTVMEVEEGFRILGHIMKKFALIEADNELWLMDVHASDERVKFERYMANKENFVMKQQLLAPMKISLTPAEIEFIKANASIFDHYGLKVSSGINPDEIFIHSVPAYFDQKISQESINAMVLDMMATVGEEDEKSVQETPFSKIEYRVVSRLSCHGAVRSGYFISNIKIREILNDLMKCKNPWTCAHGRPTIIRVKQVTLEGWFRRNG